MPNLLLWHSKKKTTNSEQCENSLLGQDEEHKVQLFWEGHKNLCHPSYGFDKYLGNVKTIRRMAQIVVPFSEKLHFKGNLLTIVVKKLARLKMNLSK